MIPRALCLLLVLTAWVSANEKGLPSSFRLTENLELWRRGYIRDANKTEFRFQAFDSTVPVTFLWKQIHPSDARPIQRALGLRHGLKQKGYIVAHRLLLRDGTTREGLLQDIQKDGRHVLLTAGRTEMFDLADVKSVEIAYLPEYRVYSKETLFKRWSRQRPPTTVGEHMEYAERLFLIGRYDKSMAHLKEAIELAADLDITIDIEPRVEILRGIQSDRELKRAVSDATSALLHGNYERARSHLERHREVFPKNAGAVRKLLERLQAREFKERTQRFQREKHDVFDALIDESVRKGLRGLSEARSFVTNQLPLRMRAHFIARWGITGAEYDRLLQEARRGAPHFATYGSGSFIVNRRGVKGGNAYSYWSALTNDGRQAWMRAYAAERLEDIFEIVGVTHRDCSKCGGTGRIKFMSLRTSKQWKEVCSRCKGSRTDRAVRYR